MTDTANLALPLLAPAQAQKHVTVNEALARIDAAVQLTLQSRSLIAPPATPAEGACYAVPVGAMNDWSGQDGRIAAFVNGGWTYIAPARGWRAWIVAEGAAALWDGEEWVTGRLALSPHGAGAAWRVAEIDHAVGAGATSETAAIIPSHAMVFGATARVIAPLAGSLTSWQLGVAGAPDRFGSGLGLSAGSYARGMLGQPVTQYAPTPLLLTATGGAFAGGTVRIAVHYLELLLPAL